MLNIFISFLLITSFQSENKLKIVHEKDGIQVFSRNKADSDIKEFMGIVEVDATVEQCLNQLKSTQQYSRFMYKVSMAKRLENRSETEWVNYCVLDLPFPVKNSDMVLLNKLTKHNNGSISVHFSSITNVLPEQKDLKRLEEIAGSWTFTPITAERTKITHRSQASSAGFPNWLVNLFIVNAPKETLTNFRKYLILNKN